MTRRRIVIAASAVALLSAMLLGWRALRKKPELRFETQQADRGPLVAKVTATGTLSALVTVQVGSQVSGTVRQIMVDFNSKVKKGQVIAKIDPQLFQAAVEQARANLTASRGNLTKAKAQATDADRQARRSRALADQKLVAVADAETAEANADAARAQVEATQGTVEQAAAALHQAEVNLAYTTIVSPTSGVVISRNIDVGQTVAASLQAPTLFVIAEDLTRMQVDTSVAEADVGKLRDKMAATFTVDAFPGERFTGTVRQIRNAPQTVQNVVTYDAVIDVANKELRLRPGMTANVTFVWAERDDALRVPNAALRFRPPPEVVAAGGDDAKGGARAGGGRSDGPVTPAVAGRGFGGNGAQAAPGNGAAPAGGGRDAPGRRTLWVLRGGRPAPAQIKTGISDGSLTEVVEGKIDPGDACITDATGGSKSTSGPQAGGPPMRRVF